MAKGKLTPELQQKICDYISQGNYNDTACKAVGISTQTFYVWLKRGAESTRGIYADFSGAVKKAQAQAEAWHLSQITAASRRGIWQASAWYLERKHPERWGRHERRDLNISGKGDSSIKIEPVDYRAASSVLSPGDDDDNNN